jgi:DNA-binding NarL/FixJ family response regulator
MTRVQQLVTVAVCDSEPVAIEGLRSLLDTAGGPRVVAAESTLADGADAVRELRPSLVVVDKAFGVPAIAEWMAGLRETRAGFAAIAWGSSISEAEAVKLVQAGAAGVIRKTASLDQLMACIRKVTAGGTWMEEDLARGPEWPSHSGRRSLTPRERQVMELVERGMKNKAIAAELGIRTGTVKIHLKHIFEKTGIRGRYGLALNGLKEKGLLVPAMQAM